MLDLGFFEDVETILSRCPSGRQTALFSATMPPEIKRLAEQGMYDPVTIKVKAATLTIDTVEQFFVDVSDRDKQEKLVEVVKAERPDQAIIFVRTKIGADRLSRRLNDAGVRVKALHGDMSQGQRDGVMIAFKSERERLLVATDVAARGPRHLGRHARDQLRRTELARHLRAPDRPHRPCRAIRARDHVHHPEAAARPRGDRAPREDRDRPVVRGRRPPRRSRKRERPEREARRPRHTKPRKARDGARTKLIVKAGLKQGLEPADVIGAIVDHSHLEGEDISNVRLLDRFSFVEVPGLACGGGCEHRVRENRPRRSPETGGCKTMSAATLHTNHGAIEVEFFDEDAPKTVENFRKLAGDGFYDGLIFHRVIKDFMIQGGCPQGTGTGGPGYTFEDEFNQNKIERGALAMANAGPDTNGSQFFIVTTDAAPWLDGKHTVFGKVTNGMDAVDSIEGTETGAQDRPVEDVVIERVELSD